MKFKYDKIKGHRVKKGTHKVNTSYKSRINMFSSLTVVSRIDNTWWCEDTNRWGNIEDANNHSFSSNNHDIKNLKQAIRHIKKHKELKKGTVMRLCSNFVGYSIDITV